MKILLTEPREISPTALDILISHGHKIVTDHGDLPDSNIGGLFIRTYTHVTEAYLDQFPALSVIIRAGVGLDNIDLSACQSRQIQIFNSPGANSTSVAEHALTMILTLLKNIGGHVNNLRQGIWRSRTLLGNDLHGKNVGLVGCGAVGQKLAKLLQPFEVTLLGYDKYVNPQIMAELAITPSTLDNLLVNSDIISIQVPLTDETKNLITRREFALMQKSTYLINVSRGEILDESDLIKVLLEHRLAGVAIDVVIGEPNPNPRLFALDNLLLTPHIAGFTKQSDEAIAVQAVNNFIASTKGQV